MAADNVRLASMPNTTPSRTTDLLSHRLSVLASGPQRDALTTGLRGIERESLRVTPDGQLAMTPHPHALGSALTHPSLTTDYSEALIELITPAEHDAAITLDKLDELHRFVYAKLGGEILWNNSMPGLLPDTDDGIPIAQYGASNIGKLKYVYRVGLALRYGRTMQTIAGIHYNYSLNEEVWRLLHADQQSTASAVDFQSERYLALIRNFRRTNWLLMYLFGASPALDRRFLRDRKHTLETFDADTLYRPYATSLRMSDLGYSNTTAQAALHADYDTLHGLSRCVGQRRSASRIRRTRKSARNATASGCRSTPTCCRSKTSSTRRSAPNASPIRASVRCMRSPRAACNTSKCAAWISIRSSRPALRSKPRAFSTPTCWSARSTKVRSLPPDAYCEANQNFGRVTHGRAQARPRTDARRPADRHARRGPTNCSRRSRLPPRRSTRCAATTRTHVRLPHSARSSPTRR